MNGKNEFDNEFEKLAKQDKLPISSIEDLMLKNIESYKNELLTHTEELLWTNETNKGMSRKMCKLFEIS